MDLVHRGCHATDAEMIHRGEAEPASRRRLRRRGALEAMIGQERTMDCWSVATRRASKAKRRTRCYARWDTDRGCCAPDGAHRPFRLAAALVLESGESFRRSAASAWYLRSRCSTTRVNQCRTRRARYWTRRRDTSPIAVSVEAAPVQRTATIGLVFDGKGFSFFRSRDEKLRASGGASRDVLTDAKFDR